MAENRWTRPGRRRIEALLVTWLLASACTESRIPAGIEHRAIRECQDAILAASPDHLQLSLSDPMVRQGKGLRYRVRGMLNGHESPGAVECHLDDTRGTMEVLHIAVLQG